MKNYFAALLVAAAFPGIAQAQQYFQQEVNYKINVSLNDEKHELIGTEEIEYINNSPDQLSFIYFHLWPNGYKNNKTNFAKQAVTNGSRKFYFTKPENRGFIDGLAFEVNNKPVKLEYEKEDIAKLILNEPLQPGQRITIRTPFHVKIPGAFSRLGHVDQSYQISQWYPKPAVYDRKGWHQMPYLDQGEFFSEYGKFDVKITLPANYNVGATGVLQTQAEIARMDSLAAVAAAKTDFGTDMTFPASSTKTKTLQYVQDRVHDFAWFADKRFNLLKSEATLPVSKTKVTTWIMFLNKNAKGWVKEKNDINEAIEKYSGLVGEYPYSSATAVDGALGENAGGMEYPMVTVTMPNAIIHEVGHNWFYGILGSNERDYPWQDEGVNCYIENRIAETNNPNAGQFGFLLEGKFRDIFGLQDLNANGANYLLYQMANSRGLDQPIQYHSAGFTKNNYGGIVYMKAPVALNYLEGYLGKERFDKAMHAYFEQWKFKHPYPEDMQATFEATTGEKLDWFFKVLLTTTKPVDIGIKDAGKTAGGATVTLKNEGAFAAPAQVAARDNSGQVVETQWSKPFTGRETLTFNTPGIDKFEVDPNYLLPETDRQDNALTTSGFLRKLQIPHLQLLAGLNQNRKSQLYFMPVIGANTADKFMLGAAFYNSSLVPKKVNYLLMPMYSFSKNEVNGIGNVNFNFISRNGFLRQTIVGLNYQRFEFFRKYEPSINFNFRQSSPDAFRHTLKLAYTIVNQDKTELLSSFENPDLGEFNLLHTPEDIVVPNLTYRMGKSNGIEKFSFMAKYLFYSQPDFYDGGNHAVKAEINYERYWSQKKKFNARLFGGKFFSRDVPGFVMGVSGSPDYLREAIFLDRAQHSEKIRAFVDQTDGQDGGFKNYLPLVTNNWLTTLNLQTELPKIPLLDLYLDLGWMANYNKTLYGTGLALNIGDGFFSLYLPVAGSNFADTFPENFKDFRQNIRFALHINKLNPFKLLNENL
jgi:hypothetical protein